MKHGCGTCMWAMVVSTEFARRQLQCHRYPPTVVKVFESGRQEIAYPHVDAEVDGCGEHVDRDR